MQMVELSTRKRQRTDGEEEGVGESSDSERLLSSEAGNSNRNQKTRSTKKTYDLRSERLKTPQSDVESLLPTSAHMNL